MGNGNFNVKDMTKRKCITKSIQFELIPQGKTAETMEEKGFNDIDEQWRELVSSAQPYIDSIVRDYAEKALAELSDTLQHTFRDGIEKKDESKIITISNKAVEKAVKEASEISVGQIKSNKFIQDVMPEYISRMDIPESEKAKAYDIIGQLKGKTELMNEFFTTRITAMSVWMPKRLIENYRIYERNVEVFKILLASDLAEAILSECPEVENFTESGEYASYTTQAGINAYNAVINGVYGEEGAERKGVRQLVNEFNQQNKNSELPLPKELYKQILMPREKAFAFTTIKTDDQLREAVAEATEAAEPAAEAIMDALKDATPEDVVIRYGALHTLSHAVCGDHATLPDIISQNATEELNRQFDEAKTAKKRNTISKKMEKIENALRKEEWTVSELSELTGNSQLFDSIKTYITAACKNAVTMRKRLSLDTDGNIRDNKELVLSLKEYFDAWKDARDAVRTIRRRNVDKGSHLFYGVLDDATRSLKPMEKAEGMAVSYITRKPKDVARKETASMGYAGRIGSSWIRPDEKMSIKNITILRKGGKYYLFALTPGTKPASIIGKEGSGAYVFAQKKGQNSMQALPCRTFTQAGKFFDENPDADEFVITEKLTKPVVITRDLYNIKNENLYTTSAVKEERITQKKYEENLFRVLSMYKEFMDAYTEYSLFDIRLKEDLHDYKDSGEFFEDVNKANVACMWLPADLELMENMVENGDALCFLINSRDLYKDDARKSAYSRLLLTALSEDNKDVFLNASPKMFFREQSIKKPAVHKTGSILVNKRDKNGEKIPDDVYEEVYRYYNNKTGAQTKNLSDTALAYIKNGLIVKHKAEYDIVKDRRYTADKWFIQFSIKKNRSAGTTAQRITQDVCEALPKMNVVSILRSETDLVYYSVTDPDGKVLERRSLNVINGTDYWKALKEVSDKRKKEKSEEWEYGRKVKDQRDAYLSLAISVIVKKVVEYNAAVCVEYIQENIKNRYDAMDNTVMKKFEGMLIARLSDLYFKDVPAGEPGSVENPYQLCDCTGDSFQDGIVFFISPAYTGNVDAETGFVNIFKFAGLATVSAKRMFLSKFDSIYYDRDKNRFLFDLDYDNFVTKTDIEKTKWTVLAGGPTTEFDREHKRYIFHKETAQDVLAVLSKNGHREGNDYAKLALDAELNGEETDALYNMFRRAVSGVVKPHGETPKTYVSPITGKEYVYNENAAANLLKRFLFQMAESVKDKKERTKWIDNIA